MRTTLLIAAGLMLPVEAWAQGGDSAEEPSAQILELVREMSVPKQALVAAGQLRQFDEATVLPILVKVLSTEADRFASESARYVAYHLLNSMGLARTQTDDPRFVYQDQGQIDLILKGMEDISGSVRLECIQRLHFMPDDRAAAAIAAAREALHDNDLLVVRGALIAFGSMKGQLKEAAKSAVEDIRTIAENTDPRTKLAWQSREHPARRMREVFGDPEPFVREAAFKAVLRVEGFSGVAAYESLDDTGRRVAATALASVVSRLRSLEGVSEVEQEHIVGFLAGYCMSQEESADVRKATLGALGRLVIDRSVGHSAREKAESVVTSLLTAESEAVRSQAQAILKAKEMVEAANDG